MHSFINLHELLNWTYLTQAPTNISSLYSRIILFIFIAFFVGSFPLFIFSGRRLTKAKATRHLFRGIGFFFILADIYGVLVYVSRQLFLPALSERLFLLIWGLILLIGFISLIAYILTKYRIAMIEFKEEEERRKYLPKKS